MPILKIQLLISILLLSLISCSDDLNVSNREPSTFPPEEARKPENAIPQFTAHKGIEVQQFASEPMMINPTNIDIDERGRVWVCEAQNYRPFTHDHPQRDEGDRILILEDTDGDGQADKSKVFYQGPDVNAALGIAKLGNKVYVAASPSLLVFTDEDGDDVPDQKDTLFTGLAGVDHDHGVHAVIFGPDGKLYFNFGNEGKRLRLKNGNLAKDIHGNVIEEGSTFRQGMIFRCNADGSDLEIMGHNFRNNFELAVDPFGVMWQSDNDDDGNQATRINYVMDYGNYGFKDQVTGEGWRVARIGMHEEIPKRHWHLNDPGVIPNLLQTGQGSPTGILVYEGDMLPDVFHHQMIHCEPGKNVVRSYPVTPKGAGYEAEIVPILNSVDGWFRPSDVCAAPDGSLMVSDWYDAGVGGHNMADIERGRIYRLYSGDNASYQVSAPDLSNLDQAILHLNHVNQATRYLAFERVTNDQDAPQALLNLIESTSNDRLKARAYWCLASLEKSHALKSATMASNEESPAFRALSLRIARQFLADKQMSLIWKLRRDPDIEVLREAAISLRYLGDVDASESWAMIADRYDGQDRWFLEALGIGSDLHADDRFTAYMNLRNSKDLAPSADVIWRLRTDKALPELYRLIERSKSEEEMVRYFRAMHFLTPSRVEPYLARALNTRDHPMQQKMVEFALGSLDPEAIANNAGIRSKLKEILPEMRGTSTWTMIIRNAKLKDEALILWDSALVSTEQNFKSEAAKLVASLAGNAFIQNQFEKADISQKTRILELAGYVGNNKSREWLVDLFEDKSQEEIIRHQAALALSKDWRGMSTLAEALESGQLDDEDAETVATYLSRSWRNDIQQLAIDWITENKGTTPIDLATIAQQQGDIANGAAVFEEFCQGCHMVKDKGTRFGPNLDGIGTKLGKDALLDAIVYPSMGVGFGYEGFIIETDDGKTYSGYIESEAEDELSLRLMGGVSQLLDKGTITKKEAMSTSLMTANLHQLMDEQQLVDLIEYLSSLKGTEAI